jgi:iron(III) transport system ATP-binding protein
MVDLGSFADASPASLSGGQRQRVAIARAVVYRPRTLLMDEPMSSLDRGLRDDMTAEIKRLQVELGVSVLYVTHDQQEALTLSDQIGVLQEGRLAQLGSPADIYAAPSSRTVAKLTGPVCLAPVQGVSTTGEGCEVTLVADSVRLRSAAPSPEGGDLLAGTRPHLLRFVERPGDNRVHGIVTDVALTGTGVQYRLRLPDGPQWVMLAAEPTPGVLIGDQVPVFFSPTDTLVVTA